MCALLLKPHSEHKAPRWWERPIRGFFAAFNWGFDRLGAGYGWLTARAVRFAADHGRASTPACSPSA